MRVEAGQLVAGAWGVLILILLILLFLNTRRRFSKLERVLKRLDELIRLEAEALRSRQDQATAQQDKTLTNMESQAELRSKALSKRLSDQHRLISDFHSDTEALAYFHLSSSLIKSDRVGIVRDSGRSPRLIVSLTTVKSRLFEIAGTIESLMQQSLKPDEIVLWLNQDSIGLSTVPLELHHLQSRGLTIRFCEDIGPHTKLIPALKEFPHDVIITVDDDVYYPSYLVELLYTNYLREPGKIHCTRARRMSAPTPGMSYIKDWPNIKEVTEGLDVLPLGVGGVLYPPRILHEDVFDLDLQRRLAPSADDIWFKTMSLRRKVVCQRVDVRREHFAVRPYSQESSLYDINVEQGKNEQQIAACFEYFGLEQCLT